MNAKSNPGQNGEKDQPMKTTRLFRTQTRFAAVTICAALFTPYRTAQAAVAATAALLILAANSAVAADRTWVGNGASAIWGGVANWSPSGPANGADSTAYFTNTFNNGYRITVNTARIIGHIVFTDPANLSDLTLAKHANDYALTLAVSSNSPVINVTQSGRTITVETVVAGAAGLTKDGRGTLILARANTYTGTTAANAGTLRVTTEGSATTGVLVAGGATISILVAANDGQWIVAGDWTNADNSVVRIDYGDTAPSVAVAPIQVASLFPGANVTLQIAANSFAGLVAGQSYPLITWTTSGPANASAFVNLIVTKGIVANLSVTGSTLFLNITANTAGALSWNTGNGNWDTNSAHWLGTSGAAIYKDAVDAVLFDDAPGATGNPTVTLDSLLSPVSVTMNSASHDYTLRGNGGLAGDTSLTLEAANIRTLTLGTASTYSGDTTISGGTLRLGADNVIPDGTGKGKVTVNAGSTFDLNTFSEAINSLSGDGVVDTVAGGTATLTVGADNTGTTFSGAFQNTAGTLNLVKVGTGLLTLSGANTFTGTVMINAGTLTLNSPDTLATVSGLTLAGGTVLNPTVDNVVINGPITLGANGTTSQINGSRAGAGVGTVYTLTLNGAIAGAGNLIFNGGNQNGTAPTIILNAQSTYAGSTLITCDPNASAGLNCYVKLGTNNALPSTTVLTLDGRNGVSGGRAVALNLNGFDQTLAGVTNIPRNATRQQLVINDNATPATLTVNNATDYTFSGQLGVLGGENFGLAKTGTGRLVLTGDNAYYGGATVANGSLFISTAQQSAFQDFQVNSGAGFGIVNLGGLQSAQANNLALGNGSGPTSLSFSNVADPSTPVLTAYGFVTLNGNCTIRIEDKVRLAAGSQYPLLSCWGGIVTNSGTGFSLALPAGVHAVLTNDPTPSSIALIVTAIYSSEMLTFEWGNTPGAIAGTNITLIVPYDTDVAALSPTYTVSADATGSPASGTVQNFTTPRTYTVISGDGSITNVYTVTVIKSASIRAVDIVEVAASTEYNATTYAAVNAFNGSGLSADGNTHAASGWWCSASSIPVADQWVKVRFDRSYPLSHLRVWNYNESGYLEIGIQSADIYVINSDEDPGNNTHLNGLPFNPTGWARILANQTFVQAPSTGTITNTDPRISLGGVTARQLAIKVNANWGYGTNYAGLNEVQSYPTPLTPPTPELPGSALTISPEGVPMFNFSTMAGCTYRLVYTDDLAVPMGGWRPVTPPADGWVLGTGATMNLVDTNGLGQAQRFYRLEAANP